MEISGSSGNASIGDPFGNKIKRYPYTAVDDATRIRTLKIYAEHNQNNAIEFIDHVISKYPFRIHTIGTGDSNSMPNFTGIWKIKGLTTFILNRDRRN